MKTALFFDLDGTLWNALTPITSSWNKAMKDHGLPYSFTEKDVKGHMGLTPEETAPIAFPDVDLKTGLQYFHYCLESELKELAVHPGTLYPHEFEVLETLKSRYPLYVVSNSDKGYVENYMNACRTASFFQGHICAGDTGLSKAENIVYLQKKIKAGQVIYIGDTEKDRNESSKAHVLFIHANYGFGTDFPCQYKINALEELPEEVEKVLKDN